MASRHYEYCFTSQTWADSANHDSKRFCRLRKTFCAPLVIHRVTALTFEIVDFPSARLHQRRDQDLLDYHLQSSHTISWPDNLEKKSSIQPPTITENRFGHGWQNSSHCERGLLVAISAPLSFWVTWTPQHCVSTSASKQQPGAPQGLFE